MALEFDRSILGQVFDETSFPPVTKEEITRVCRFAGRDESTVHRRGRCCERSVWRLDSIPHLCHETASAKIYARASSQVWQVWV